MFQQKHSHPSIGVLSATGFIVAKSNLDISIERFCASAGSDGSDVTLVRLSSCWFPLDFIDASDEFTTSAAVVDSLFSLKNSIDITPSKLMQLNPCHPIINVV